ncbi:MAG: 50S ribosomal protein L17 [Thermaerobacter sp.]|nr:50S ribosomal protein L17 [Thermaerobacter sp.]
MASFRKLGKPADQRRALLRGLVTSLLRHGRIQTTVPRAKEARVMAEHMITLAKRGDLHARRQALAYVLDPAVVRELFQTIGPRYQERQGGYTRILRVGVRQGDAAPMAILELV